MFAIVKRADEKKSRTWSRGLEVASFAPSQREVGTMAVFNGAFPILPGKVDTARAFAKETMGAQRAGYDESQKRLGITRETWSIQENPDGSAFVLVWFESPDPEKSFMELGQDSSDFAVWFRARVKEVSGVDLTEPPSEGGPEVVLDWEG
jgi:hypothetical protein